VSRVTGARPLSGVTVLGRGKVGRALAAGLRAAAVPVQLLSARARRPAPRHALVVLSVPDHAIASVAARLVLPPSSVVLHCAGARGPDELAPCREQGAHVAAFHPLASFADPRRRPPWSEVTFVACGDGAAIRAGRQLATALGARVALADLRRATYHGAAALAANGAVGLAFAAKAALVAAGLGPRAAERALGGLLASVAANIAHLGLPAALTGPVRRGDVETVARHQAAWAEDVPTHRASYDAAIPAIVACAAAAGLPGPGAEALLRLAAAPLSARYNQPRRAQVSKAQQGTKSTRARTRR
jgi:predicted short-subunit dehydrogenase-like oxidoreductase (DUF2520 family)